MWPFTRKEQPAPKPQFSITERALENLTFNRDFHADRLAYWENKAQVATNNMLDHERAFAAFSKAVRDLDGTSKPEYDLDIDELEKQIRSAADELRDAVQTPSTFDTNNSPRLGDAVKDRDAPNGMRILDTPEKLNAEVMGSLPIAEVIHEVTGNARTGESGPELHIPAEQKVGRAKRKSSPETVHGIPIEAIKAR